MADFYFEAVDQNNNIISGDKVASSEEEVAAFLKLKNYTIITINQKGANKLQIGNISSSIKGGISANELADFSRNMSTMIKSGLPIAEAISIIAEDTKSKKFQKILEDIKYDLESGRPLSQAMAKFPDVFDKTFISLIGAGEMSGKMPEVLTNLYKHLAKNVDLRNKIISAFTYPIVVMVALVGMGIIMLVVVVPKIVDIFSRMSAQIPFTLKALQFLSLIFVNYWYISYPLIIALIIIIIFYFQSSAGKKAGSKILQKIPYLSNLSKAYDYSRLTSTLSLLLRAGVPMTDSLQIVSEGIIDVNLKNAILESEKEVKEGKSLSKAFSLYGHEIPNMLIKIVRVGEKSGKMDQVLQELGEYYDTQVSITLKTVSDLIEPVLMLFVGIVVAILVISIISPIYGIVGNFSTQ